jgi:hypothetical protein
MNGAVRHLKVFIEWLSQEAGWNQGVWNQGVSQLDLYLRSSGLLHAIQALSHA